MKKITLQPDTVKWLALIAMTLDHADKVFVWSGNLCDTIGRWAFPIFSYLIIQNFCQYHPVKKYLLRLGVFGVLTSLIWWWFGVDNPNVLFTFLYAIFFLVAVEKICSWTQSLYWQMYLGGLLFLCMMPLILTADYSIFGFFFLMALYAYKGYPTRFNYLAVLFCGGVMNASGIVPVISTLIILVLLMSVLRLEGSKRLIKWWGFYIYYPLHRLLFHALNAVL